MRKLNYFLTLVAGTMLMSACSNDKEVVVSVNDNAVQQIVLQVASNGDGLTTRAGRELLSNEAGQEIDNVDLYIVSTGETPKIVYTYNNNDWKNATEYANGKMASINLKGNDKLATGRYKVYALGYSNGSNYKIPTFVNENPSENANQVNISDIENYVLTYKENVSTPEEIFAGSIDLTVGEDCNFSEAIILHRQVAGTYFYVYNLPMIKGLNTECKIQLIASDHNDQLVLGKFATADHDNGNNSDTDVMYVVNGKKSNNPVGSNVVCEAKIGDWYSDIKEATDESDNKTGIVDKAYWKGSKQANRQGGYVKGSIFKSSFVLPFKNTGNQTLTLQIVDKNDNPLRTWNVNLPKAPTAPFYFNTESLAFTQSSETEDVHNYSIVRNHLYCVGTKSKENPSTDPENPDDPDPNDPDPDDPDPNGPNPNDPQDLSKGENLVLKVNHNWEVIYKMELE